MCYNNSRQIYSINLNKNNFVKLLYSRIFLTLNYPALSRLSQLNYLLSKCLSKLPLGLIGVLLPYSVNTQALSATTVQVINGSEPYLTFDGGVTKANDTNSLLGITLSDGTVITPENNTSATTPIELPNTSETLADVQMLVPTTADSITLNELIGAPNNYWGDDDGDGLGANGITVSGSLSVSITDNMNNKVSRSATLDICQAPYKVELTSTNGSLTTQYGVPNSSNFGGSSAIYYINPKAAPTICYARPNLNWGTSSYAGPASIWNPTKGFLVQSTESSSYNRNFPTTGANNLHFDLLVGGIDPTALTWPTVTQGGITATMSLKTPVDGDFNSDGASSVRVTLTGPVATASQIESNSPGEVSIPSLPQQFELVGYDSNHKTVLKYGFVLKQWFVNSGDKKNTLTNQIAWCANIGYHMAQVKDLTNAVCGGMHTCIGAVGATPSSNTRFYQRNIGAGFFTEWGKMDDYTGANFFSTDYYWTGDSIGPYKLSVNTDGTIFGGRVRENSTSAIYGVCTYP
ncbi:hypothetical protein [Gilliamella sp. wkB112]|uniref:hypothetical protein n=1 Tax=Gilliamella sp. wkB112 TaxID=3120257 RepID=UPI00080E489A|nr:hypothetical protein [Gilliamella apicola]OCG01371.1 hypothetical protein A9G12_02145 [Gilliamella apicola]